MLFDLLHLLHFVGHHFSLLPTSGWPLSLGQICSCNSCNLRESLRWFAHPLHCCSIENTVMSKDMTDEKRWVVVGVSGVTCGGKTTFASALHSAFPGSVIIHQDAYFLPPDDKRHTLLPSLNHLNWEISTSLDMAKMTSDVREILSRPPSEVPLPLLIIEGFLIFTDQYIVSLCHHKLFFTLTCEECWARRSVRTYDPPDVPGYFEQVVWPEYERHLQLALTIDNDLTLIPGTRDIHSVVEDIKVILSGELDCKKL